jgi:hypothetical protein
MLTSASSITEEVGAASVRFVGEQLGVTLSDGREISLPMNRVPWLSWLARATPEQRANWSIEPGGFAIYWNDLDNGIEICHLLSMQPVA